MLGLGRASQYAGWWNQGGDIKINIPVATSISQAAYQTPSFSWLTGGIYPNYGNWTDPNEGSINVLGYNSLTGYNSLRCTMSITFQLPWPSGLATNTYYGGPIYRIGYPGGPYEFTIASYIDGSNRLTFTAGSTNGSGGPGIGQITYLPGTYTDYASTWFTVVYSQAETSSAYTNWSGTGSGTVYCRLAVYNAQTGALFFKVDLQQAAGNWPDITNIITGSGGSVALDQVSTYALGFRNNSGGQEVITTYAQNWISLGTMWDPLTVKAAGDTTWLTTRPNNTIGTGKAWVNHQWTNYENVSNSNWYLTDTAGDLVTGSTNNRQARIVNTGNTTVFNNSYSTSIPKDTS
jgi:hypothetical protein